MQIIQDGMLNYDISQKINQLTFAQFKSAFKEPITKRLTERFLGQKDLPRLQSRNQALLVIIFDLLNAKQIEDNNEKYNQYIHDKEAFLQRDKENFENIEEEIFLMFKSYLQSLVIRANLAATPIPRPKLPENPILHFISVLGIKIFDWILYFFGRETTYSYLSNKILSQAEKLEYDSGFNIDTKKLSNYNLQKVYDLLVAVYNKSDPEDSQSYLDFTQKRDMPVNQIQIRG
jgi:hypothetical protein